MGKRGEASLLSRALSTFESNTIVPSTCRWVRILRSDRLSGQTSSSYSVWRAAS